MDRKLIPWLVLLLIGLSTGLFWVKWKRDHPATTALDLEIRGGLITDEDASLRIFSFDEQILPHLSLQARKDIANHIWVLPQPISGKREDNYFGLEWGSETIIINQDSASDFHESTVGDLKNDTFIITQHRLHPATSRFLREWFASHANVMQYPHR